MLHMTLFNNKPDSVPIIWPIGRHKSCRNHIIQIARSMRQILAIGMAQNYPKFAFRVPLNKLLRIDHPRLHCR